eukprot:m.1454 g.1454  ORF g.1454 m.1454 type:complete len:76 (-) comp552_c0_seq1:101-328(-)
MICFSNDLVVLHWCMEHGAPGGSSCVQPVCTQQPYYTPFCRATRYSVTLHAIEACRVTRHSVTHSNLFPSSVFLG